MAWGPSQAGLIWMASQMWNQVKSSATTGMDASNAYLAGGKAGLQAPQNTVCSPVNTNAQWFPIMPKWCRILSIHSRGTLQTAEALFVPFQSTHTQRETLKKDTSEFPRTEWGLGTAGSGTAGMVPSLKGGPFDRALNRMGGVGDTCGFLGIPL